MSSFTPHTVEQLQQQIQSLGNQGQPFHWQRWSGPVAPPAQAIDLSALNQVVDYPFRDMTITVQAGLTVAALQQILAEQQQWLPVDVPSPEQMTIAELIVGHWYGSLVAGYGSIRDWLLGVAAVDGTGRLFHAGGRVVKNVAGYDLCKLLVGSEGKLALPAEVTLQVRARPEQIGLVGVQAESAAQLYAIWEQARLLPIKPVVLDLLPSPWRLQFAFEATSRILPELRQRVSDCLTQAGGQLLDQAPLWTEQHSLWNTLPLSQSSAANAAPSAPLFRLGVKPSQTVDVLQLAASHHWPAAGLSTRGTLWLAPPSLTPEAWSTFWTSLHSLTPGLTTHSGPHFLFEAAQNHQQKKSPWPLMQKLQQEFNPK